MRRPDRAALERALRALAAEPTPDVRLVFARADRPPARLGVLTGSFNPLTRAHAALARAALGAGLEGVLLAITVHTVDKEQVTGLSLVDRLDLLCRFAARRRRLAVGAFNQGLYVEQAQAVLRRWPEVRPTFVIGFDKVVQIFDPRYYEDREAALRALFDRAELLVAPRGDRDQADLARLLAAPENARFAGHVRPLALPPKAAKLRDLSATAVRARAARGDSIRGLVPWETARFLARKPVYRPAGGQT